MQKKMTMQRQTARKRTVQRQRIRRQKSSQPVILMTDRRRTDRKIGEITEKFALLGIPVIIDRSADEKTELAQYEWIKVYGVLFGCEEKMDKMFEKAVDEAGVQENQ